MSIVDGAPKKTVWNHHVHRTESDFIPLHLIENFYAQEKFSAIKVNSVSEKYLNQSFINPKCLTNIASAICAPINAPKMKHCVV